MEDYDTDSISITSTVDTDDGGEYEVQDIISEGWDDDGTKYLVAWEGYPLDKCTWEPPEHLEGTNLIQAWNRRRATMTEKEFIDFTNRNTDAFDKACDEAEEARRRRQEKRAKKRRKLGITRSTLAKDSDSSSDDDLPLMNSRKVHPSPSKYGSLFVGHEPTPAPEEIPTQSQMAGSALAPRRPPLEQSSESSSSDSSPDVSSDDSLMESLSQAQKQNNRKEKGKHPDRRSKVTDNHKLGHSLLSRKDKDSKSAMLPPARPPVLTGPALSRKPSNPSSAVRTSANYPKATTGIEPPAPIKFVDQPAPVKKKSQSDKLFTTLKSRHLANKRAEVEKPPDFNSLDFVHGLPAIRPEPRPLTQKNDPYGRRDTTNHRTQDGPSPGSIPRQKAITNSLKPSDEPLRGGVPPQRVITHPSKPKDERKIPEICPEWRFSNSCVFGPEKCRYLHRDLDPYGKPYEIADVGGRVKPKHRTPPVTCWFWYHGDCHRTAEQCWYAHEYTGYCIDQNKNLVSLEPPQNKTGRPEEKTCRFWKNGGCKKPAGQCNFAHHDVSTENGSKLLQPHIRTDEPQGTSSAGRLSEHETLHRKVSFAQPDESLTTKNSITRKSMDDAVSAPGVEMTGTDTEKTSPKSTTDLSQKREVLPCSSLKRTIEQACDLDFEEMFKIDISETKSGQAKKRAFLLFHPESHSTEVDIITRWLWMHHVEVCSTWYDGAWNYFREQTLKCGSGVIITHPGFELYYQIPGFGELLRKCKHVNVWSIGIQPGLDSSDNLRYQRIELFPHGGLIYITDEVFEKPQLALKIMELFISKIDKLFINTSNVRTSLQEVVGQFLLWRLCVRPEFMKYLEKACEDDRENETRNKADAISRAALYTLLSRSGFIDYDSEKEPFDYDPIISAPRQVAEQPPLEYFKTRERSQNDANMHMICLYNELQIEARRRYRHLYVVHPEPSAPYVQQWEEELTTIAEVMTPQQLIEELERPPSINNKLDFGWWAMEGM